MVVSDGRHRLIHEKSKTTIYEVGEFFGKPVDYVNKYCILKTVIDGE